MNYGQGYLYVKLSNFSCIFASFNANFPQVRWKLHSWLLTVWPIPSTCMVALCTRSKPWPVTVIVLPPLWHVHTNTQRIKSKNVKCTLICKYWGTLRQNNREASLAYVIKEKHQKSATHILCYWKNNSEETLHIRRTVLCGFLSAMPAWNPIIP